MAKVKIFTSLDASALEKMINDFLNENPEANTAIHYTIGSTTESENRNIYVPLYSALIYYS